MAEGFTCEVDEKYRSACKGLDFYGEHEGKRYCVLHFPSKEKEAESAFQEVLERKLAAEDYNFAGVYFPSCFDSSTHFEFDKATCFCGAHFKGGANFHNITFKEKADFKAASFDKEVDFGSADFDEADFTDTSFKKAKFDWATFGWADFRAAAFGWVSFFSATFSGWVDFQEATFGTADFFHATFEKEAFFFGAGFEDVRFDGANFEEGADFRKATFEEAEFHGVAFEERPFFSDAILQGYVDFNGTTFKDGAAFWTLQTVPQTVLDFQNIAVEKPERFSFHSTHLRPSWFIDVDAQKFDFSDVEWFRLPNGDELTLEREIEAVEARDYKRPASLRKLQKACRKLMNNAEENRDYPTANEFHYWAMELLRKESWWRRLGLIGTLYWALSGYGERPRRAFVVLVGMWAVFAILYQVTGSIEHVGQASLYSLAAMGRLTGVPVMSQLTKLLEPSDPGLFQLLVTAEGILGPLQIALLALAIRRQVMR